MHQYLALPCETSMSPVSAGSAGHLRKEGSEGRHQLDRQAPNLSSSTEYSLSHAEFWTSWMKNYMGLSENSVPLNPMVNDHYPY